MHDINIVLSKFDKVIPKANGQYMVCCPAHDDKNPSLSIKDDCGKAVINCLAGCPFEKVEAALGLVSHPSKKGYDQPIVDATYDYKFEDEKTNFQVIRYLPKTFKQRKNEHDWTVKDCPKTPFRLELWHGKQDPVFIVEGERDVLNLETIGLMGTCNAGGAGKWKPEHSAYLKGRVCYILPDNDDPGRKHGKQVAASLQGIASVIKIVKLPDLPDKGDVSDFIKSRHTAGKAEADIRNEIEILVNATAVCVPKPIQELPVMPPPLESSLNGDPIARAKAGDPLPCTDVGNVERFYYHNAGKFVFDVTKGIWRVWNGRIWEEDNGSAILKAATETIRNIRYEEAKACPDNTKGLQLFKHSISSESKGAIESMLSLAKRWGDFPNAEFDNNHWIFNCMNGTLDLKTGELKPARKEDYLAKCSPVHYDTKADSTKWDTWLVEVLQGDAETIKFLQKAVGYSLSGDISEELFFFLHGPKRTGKTTFIEAVKSMMGDYSLSTDFETFLKKKGDRGPSNDIARLVGTRFVCSCEVEDGKEMAEGVLNRVTGGDTITARFMFKEFFDFIPQFKLWFAANDAPKIRAADDNGIWRRIQRIPFKYEISKTKEDRTIKPMFKNPGIGGIQILKWAIEGCLAWQKEGITIPNVPRQLYLPTDDN